MTRSSIRATGSRPPSARSGGAIRFSCERPPPSAWWPILACAWPAIAGAQALPPTRVTIPKVAVAPTLEDYLPGGSMPGLKVTDFRQREPKDLEPPRSRRPPICPTTRANVYVAFVCTQPRSDVRARMQKREDLGADDLVGVYLDTFHDRQRAYFFFSSPLGIQGDGIHHETSGEDFSFDTQWDSRGTLTDDGYVVLITVPFKALRFPVKAGGVAGVGPGAGAHDPVEQRDRLLAGNTERVNGFIAAVRHRRRHRRRLSRPQHPVHPRTARSPARASRRGHRRPTRDENEGRAGVDVKLVPRDAFTLDFTINPDFSQVESDEPQVTVNQRFEVFFPEKRPFFLENSDFFDSPLDVVLLAADRGIRSSARG